MSLHASVIENENTFISSKNYVRDNKIPFELNEQTLMSFCSFRSILKIECHLVCVGLNFIFIYFCWKFIHINTINANVLSILINESTFSYLI